MFNWIGCIRCGDLPGLCMWLHLICSPCRKSGLSRWSHNEPLLKLNSMAAILRAAFHLTYYLRRRKCSRMCFKCKGGGRGGFQSKTHRAFHLLFWSELQRASLWGRLPSTEYNGISWCFNCDARKQKRRGKTQQRHLFLHVPTHFLETIKRVTAQEETCMPCTQM